MVLVIADTIASSSLLWLSRELNLRGWLTLEGHQEVLGYILVRHAQRWKVYEPPAGYVSSLSLVDRIRH